MIRKLKVFAEQQVHAKIVTLHHSVYRWLLQMNQAIWNILAKGHAYREGALTVGEADVHAVLYIMCVIDT